MQPIRIVLDDAPENIQIPVPLHHQRIEVIFWPLDSKNATTTVAAKIEDIESACGILQASHSVSLEQMDAAIKQRGGSL